MKIESKALSDALLANFAPKQNGDGGDFSALLKHAETKQSEGAAELEKYLKMTPAERMTQAMLGKLGITQAEFDAMTPEQQAAITAKITQMIREEMEQKMAQQPGATSASKI
ncbi:hypothetical protein KW842_22925 [Duganella sp. sic0402]|uniref:hypothetical protein n=1 Tax=Duganella sp. sic0402 TaxID=2854786 RepID=UPI001C467FE8|nr:hypothetical protein [Duganella sp. sic0402]MBV7538636.1 hypothetical protein [Duganella sp. sic0402]